MLISLDVETECNMDTCEDKHCKHPLDPYRNKITIIGVYYKENNEYKTATFTKVDDLKYFLNTFKSIELIGHNLKFDLHTLYVHGLDLINYWSHDTQIMAHVLIEKIPEDYSINYELKRIEKNKLLPKGYNHRKTGNHSLKILAPFFLKIDPFWEDPTNHNNEEYVLKDCEYTYKLYELFYSKLQKENGYKFYFTKLIEWAKVLLSSEIKGIKIDLKELIKERTNTKDITIGLKTQIDTLWKEAYKTYKDIKLKEIETKYEQKKQIRIEKAKDKNKTVERYKKLEDKAKSKIKDFNLDSSTQLNWLLKDYFKLNIKGFLGKESTGREVLEKLASYNKEDIKLFLEYRKNKKLCTSFFPSYLDLQVEGIIHCSFNPTGTRTGRLSSSYPNLQQVPANLHKLFISKIGYKLAAFDMESIEPIIIAYFTNDPILFMLIKDNINFHTYNTKIFFNLKEPLNKIKDLYPRERKLAKEIGLALFYGAGIRRIKQSAQKHGFMWSFANCKEKHELFKKEYQQVFNYKRKLDEIFLYKSVTNLLGRPIYFYNKEEIYMKGFNTLIQSSASDLVLDSAYKITKEFKDRNIKGNVLLLVHDELVVEIPEEKEREAIEIIKEQMTDFKLITPQGAIALKVEGKASTNWSK